LGKLTTLVRSTLFIALIAGLFFAARTNATTSTWATSDIHLSESRAWSMLEDASLLNTPGFGTNNIPCQKRQIKTDNTHQTSICMYDAGSALYGSGYLLLNGTAVAGTLKSQMSTSSALIALPNQQRIVELVSGSGQFKVYVYDNPYTQLTVARTAATGATTYTLPNNPRLIKDNDGSTTFIGYNTFRLSDNGKWAVADTMGTKGLVRIDITSGEVIHFAPTRNNNYSLNAISDTGNYAVVSTQSPQNSFIIYSLKDCPVINVNVWQCTGTDLLQKVTAIRPSFYGVVNAPRFINEDLLEFYGTYDRISTSNRKIGLFYASPNTQMGTKTNYLALGDSFSSGEGTYTYRPETNTADNKCHVSPLSYSYILHNDLQNTGSFASVACSGAKIKDVTTVNIDDYRESKPQAINKFTSDYNDEIYSNFLPGYRAQLIFANLNQPKIITMSMGGNDVGFSAIIKKCVMPSIYENTCYKYYEDRKSLVNTVNAQYQRLVDMYSDLLRASPDSRLYVIGYPELAMANGNCSLNVGLNNDEIIFSNQLVGYLNSVIEMAANKAGAYYVDIHDAFYGHRLCETTTPNVAINGITLGRNGSPFATESYHPNTIGHILMATKISQKTMGLSAPMPAPLANDPVFLADTENPFLQGAPQNNGVVFNAIYDENISVDTLLKNRLAQINIASANYSLAPNSNFTAVLYSTPTTIGTLTTDANGNLNGALNMPNSMPVGYHTLHITGLNILGEPVDIEKIVYVAETEDDIDGDGISDANEACVVVEPSGIDIDKDGLDDACDGFIDNPPTPSPEPEEQPNNPAQSTENPQDQTTQPTPETKPVVVVANQSNEVIQTSSNNTNYEIEVAVAATTQNSATNNNQQIESITNSDSKKDPYPLTDVAGITDTTLSKNVIKHAWLDQLLVAFGIFLSLLIIVSIVRRWFISHP